MNMIFCYSGMFVIFSDLICCDLFVTMILWAVMLFLLLKELLSISWVFSTSVNYTSVVLTDLTNWKTFCECPEFFACNSGMLCAFKPFFRHLSVRLSVCPSHSWAVSKRCMLGSWNLHYGLPQGLVFHDKILCLWVRGFPSNEGVKEG